MPTQVMTGGEAAVAALEALGVRHVFGIVSVHNLPIVDAISRSPTVTMVEMRHEQGAVHAADGYARATGGLGVALASTGPGTANAMGGLFEAQFASSRVLLLTSQSETGWYGKGRATLHEAEQQTAMLRTVCRFVTHVRHHAAIVPTVFEAARDIGSGRPQPGAVEIPIDVQQATGEVRVGEPQPPVVQAPAPAVIAHAAELLGTATRPLVWAGGGVISGGAAAELTALAERLSGPVLTSVEGRGSIAEDHPLALGPNADLSALDGVIAEADVVLAVGTRFQLGSNVAKALSIPGRLIHLDADPGVVDRFHPVDVAIVADARLGLLGLLDALPAGACGRTDDAFLVRAREARATAEAETRDAMGPDHEKLAEVIRCALPRDAVVVKDATVAAYLWANRTLPVYEPRTSLRPVSMAIGPGLPLAIGACVGAGRRTLVIHGDGGLMLSVGELAAVVQQNLPLITCVFNDRGYGILRFVQDLTLGGRRSAVDLVTPDFGALAQSVGMAGEGVSTAEAFAASIDRAVQRDGPTLIDVDITAMAPMTIRPQRPSNRRR
jgi:acetolactate synthase-1/2/3 large subunit